MKKVLLIFALLLVLVGGMLFTQNYFKKGDFFLFKKDPTATINSHTFKLRVADSQKDREIGLSETESLAENQGMIFIFDKPDYYSFWMKNMKFPIDIIFINKDNIVMIQNNVQPPTTPTESPIIYSPTKPSDKVLEIQAGLSKKYNFKKGNMVKYENLGNRDKL